MRRMAILMVSMFLLTFVTPLRTYAIAGDANKYRLQTTNVINFGSNGSDIATCITHDSEGNKYVVAGQKIYKFNVNTYTPPVVIAGNVPDDSHPYNDSDGTLATDAVFYRLGCLTIGGDNTIYLTETNFQDRGKILKIDSVGRLKTLVGNFESTADPHDGQLALEASLHFAGHLTVSPLSGQLYFSDNNATSQYSENGLVRRLNSDGTLTTIVGDSSKTVNTYTEGGQANQQIIGGVDAGGMSLSASPSGDLYVANRTTVYKVSSDGTIHYLLGGGSNRTPSTRTYSETGFNIINNIKVEANGGLYISSGTSEPQTAPTDGGGLYFAGDDGYVRTIYSCSASTCLAFQKTIRDSTLLPDGSIQYLDFSQTHLLVKDFVPPSIAPVDQYGSQSTMDTDKWYKGPVSFYWYVFDDEASSPSQYVGPMNVTTEAINHFTSATYCDAHDNCASKQIDIKIDGTKPAGSITTTLISHPGQQITGTATDNVSGVKSVQLTFTQGSSTFVLSSDRGEVNITGCNATRTSCSWNATSPVSSTGIGTLELKVTDVADNLFSTSSNLLYLAF